MIHSGLWRLVNDEESTTHDSAKSLTDAEMRILAVDG